MKKYWLIFKPGSIWISFFCKKKFGHISVLTRDKFNWVMINPTIYNLEVKILDATIDTDVVSVYRGMGYKMIYIERNDFNKKSFFSLFKICSCVEMVKYLVGLKIKAFTPYGLYKELLKHWKSGVYPSGVNSMKFIN